MDNLVTKEWLLEQLGSDDLVIADVRFAPGDSSYGLKAYTENHIPGAVFINFKEDLVDPPREHGGRSPLPDPERLAEKFGKLGIDQTTRIVVYDDSLRPEATRLWWILNYLGHEQVYILDGGYTAWEDAKLPITSEETTNPSRIFEINLRNDWLADVDEVRASLGQDDVTLVDSRDLKQYLGVEAPFDPVAGRIPGATLAFWKDGASDDGTWKSSDQQRERFSNLDPANKVIVYCGSGLSACPNVLSLREAGFEQVKLYAGSWSDWISYEGNPVATGEE